MRLQRGKEEEEAMSIDEGKNLQEPESEGTNADDENFEFLPEKNTNRTVKIILVPVLTVIIAAAVFLAMRYFPAESRGLGTSPVRINELMPSADACPNADGVFCEYIELYNDSDSDVDISGFQLTDNVLSRGLIFDSGTTVPANGYLVVSCGTGKEQANAIYAPFSVSRDGGETITLKNAYGLIVSSVITIELGKNEAMIYKKDGQWAAFNAGTPGCENSVEGRYAYLKSLSAPNGIVISELMAKNITSCVSNSGEHFDWIEISNTTTEAIDIGGYHISDDALELSGFTLPPYVLEAKECVLVYASKEAKYENGEIHADFSLAGEGETLLLFDQKGRIVCSLEYPELADNHSYMLTEDGYVISSFSSPGGTETQPVENEYEGLIISELMTSNTAGITDSDGDFSDWIELTNDSSGDLSLSGCWLTNDAENCFCWQLPEIIIKSGESFIVFASGKESGGTEIHASFKLPSDSGTVVLTSPNGYTIDSVNYETSAPDRSLMRGANGFEITAYSSPGYANGTEGYIAYQQSLAVTSPLIISEVMTANDTVLAQSYGSYYDWIEVKNAGEAELMLSDYYLSDDAGSEKLWQMPEVTLKPGEYKVFLCSGDIALTTDKYAHTNFSLNSQTETLFLFDKDGRLCDRMLLCDIPANASAGRMDEENGLFLFEKPTPKAQNTGGARAVSTVPYSTTAAGMHNTKSLTVPLFAEGDIYYTTDGSWPDSKSNKYTEPLTLTSSAVIRAIAYGEGSMKSSVTTLSFFLNEGNTLPIMSLCANPSDIWNSSTGIYSATNAFRDWEKDAHIEFFETDGGGFSIDCGLSLFGGGTRLVSSKKSFQVRFRSVYGEESLVYDMFYGSDVNEFKSLVFRAGQDSRHTIFRDEIFTSIAVEESPTLLAQRSRYCLLYINGKFFGIYCIKERLGDDYYAAHFNVPIESVEVVKGPVKKDTGIYELISFVAKNDMRIEENYEYVESKLDIDSLIDWYIFESCSGNCDISGNVRYIRSSEGDGKWRLALFDVDFTLRWPINDFGWLYNDSNQHAIFLKRLIKNAEFKDKFLTRFGYLLNNVFTEEKLQQRIDSLAAELRGDVERERSKWHSNLTFDEALRIMDDVLHKYDYKGRIVSSVCKTLSLTQEEREKYFGS